jgi:chromosome segregation ATPase
LRSTPDDDTEKPHTAPVEESTAVRDSLETLQRQQAEILRSLDALKASDDRREMRLIAVETQIATQSAMLAEVRRTLSDNQREQWRTLDVLSDGLDRILETEPVASIPNVAGAGSGSRPRGASRSQESVR